mgnify:CR=1 FL=1
MHELQKQFILTRFFANDMPGWRTIGTKLIENGRCIVAGTERIWKGGIGNFIEVKPAEGTFECSLYTFDLKSFLKSELYKEEAKAYKEYAKNAFNIAKENYEISKTF